MLDLSIVRARWDFLSTIHPLFLYAESLPTVDGADEGDYGNVSVDDVDHLKNEITMLRNDFKLNIIKQQQVDFDQLAIEDSTLEGLKVDLQLLLEKLENLVDSKVVDNEELEVSCVNIPPLFLRTPLHVLSNWSRCTNTKLQRTDEAEALSCFLRLVALRNLLRQQDSPEPEWAPDTEYQSIPEEEWGISGLAQTNFTSVDTESDRGKKYSHASVAQAASYIWFPQEANNIESCRRVVSRFGTVLDRLLGDSVGPWTMEAQTLDYTTQDVEAIQHAYDFASTCTSLFGRMVNSTKCGTLHRATLHLSGFKTNELRMNIDTCQETGWIPALFTR